MDELTAVVERLGSIWDYRLLSFADGNQLTVGHLITAILLLVVGFILARWLSSLLARRLAAGKFRPDAAFTLQRLLFFLLLVAVFMLTLRVLGISLTAFAFISGAVAIGVGLGAQNIINNFISGWILMSERPVRIGDFIEIDDVHGVVERIGNRSTRLRRVDGVHMLVPNSQMLERMVVNWTLVDQDIRTRVRVGVVYGSPVELVARLIREAVEAQERVLTSPEPAVVFEDFGDNALIFDTYFWCQVGGEKELREVRSDIRFAIVERFAEHDLVIAFPQRDVHLDTVRPLEVRMLDPEARQEDET